MSALPPKQVRAMRSTANAARHPVGSIAKRWERLHQQAGELAKLAGLAVEPLAIDPAELAATLGQASDWQRGLAWQGIEDIDAMMQPGLTALRTITARGQDAAAPALALWREFHAAREGVLAVIRRSVPAEAHAA